MENQRHGGGPVWVAPSVLSADFADMAGGVRLAEAAGADLLHCDVMDGEFVPNLSFGPKMVADIRKRTKLPLDVHLMIIKPQRYIERFIDAGADYVTIHIEAAEEPERTLADIRKKGAKCGIVLNPGTSLRAAERVFPLCDMILLMSVQPGFGGQSFIPPVMDKIRQLRTYLDRAGSPCRLEIDGGITLENIAEVRAAGADTIVAGNTFYSAADKAAAIRTLRGE